MRERPTHPCGFAAKVLKGASERPPLLPLVAEAIESMNLKSERTII